GAIVVTMNTAGKAVLFSGVTVLISLSAVLLVPIPAFRSMAAGMMLAVTFVPLAALTVLPAIIVPWAHRLSRPWPPVAEHRRPWLSVPPEARQTRIGYELLRDGYGPAGPGRIQLVVGPGVDAEAVAERARSVPGVAAVFPPQPGQDGYSMVTVIGANDPSSSE